MGKGIRDEFLTNLERLWATSLKLCTAEYRLWATENIEKEDI
jgi:hypothetical protein